MSKDNSFGSTKDTKLPSGKINYLIILKNLPNKNINFYFTIL